MRDERGCLRAYFAALKAETTVDAVWTVSARCGKDRHGSLAATGMPSSAVRKRPFAPWPSFSQDEIDAVTRVLKSAVDR
jgi:hypothetical protein